MPKLSRPDLLLAFLGLVGVVTVVTLYTSAFPLALVELEVTRDEALDRAEAFLTDQGADLTDYRRAARFTGDTEALVFLQKSLPDETAAEWARDQVPVWTWDIRWFQPGETEEWMAYVGVDGDIVGFRHVIEESAEGADLDEAAARELAEKFLQSRGWEMSGLEAVQASADKKDARTDHLFVWEVAGSEIRTDFHWDSEGSEESLGTARVVVRVLGDEVGSYGRFLRVPEEFSRGFENVQSKGAFLAVASIVITVMLALAALVIAIMRFRSGDIDWRTAITCGAIVGVMFALYTLTAWPEAQFSYQTQIDWGVFIGMATLGLLLAAVFYVVFVTFPTAAGESLARDLFPRTLDGFADAVRGRIFNRTFAVAAWRGYALAAALLGFFTAFYWFARTFMGAWMPAEGPYSQIFNNQLPFLTPLTISLVAAISEETIYRLFGISVFRRWTKSTFLALLIPAAIWAFGHSNYPVFPVYIRGIELTLAGVLFGLAFLKFGLLACIVAHYVIDAVALGAPLVTSGNDFYLISGLVVIGLALVPGVLGLIGGRKHLPQAAMVEESG